MYYFWMMTLGCTVVQLELSLLRLKRILMYDLQTYNQMLRPWRCLRPSLELLKSKKKEMEWKYPNPLLLAISYLAFKYAGCPSSSATAPTKGLGMQLGKSRRTNQFLESLKAED
ncbi:hypothetical protein ACB092_08G058000 [Castanea dentata]